MVNFENIKDRNGYLGSTDATLVGRIGGGLRINLEHYIRLAVAYDDLPWWYLREVPQTEAMKAGHRFEDYFFEDFAGDWMHHIERQYILRRHMEDLPALIAHADGYDEAQGLVLELKFSRYLTANVAKRYHWQLQWYYFLGAEKVRLIHGSGTLPENIRIAFRNVKKDMEAQEQLMAGLCRIKEMRPKIREVAEMIELKEGENENNKKIKKNENNQ